MVSGPGQAVMAELVVAAVIHLLADEMSQLLPEQGLGGVLYLWVAAGVPQPPPLPPGKFEGLHNVVVHTHDPFRPGQRLC